jgi:hypothetical protein
VEIPLTVSSPISRKRSWFARAVTPVSEMMQRTLWALAAGVKMQNITVEKSQRFGDVDYSQGTFAATAPAGQVTGHWLTFAKCSGDVCLIQSHVSNLPMPPPPK